MMADASDGNGRTVDMLGAIDAVKAEDRFASARLTAGLWLAAVAVGVLCAVVAAVTETTTHWLTDSRTGRCSDFAFASREMCCVAATASGGATTTVVETASSSISALRDPVAFAAALAGTQPALACAEWLRWGDASRDQLINPAFGAAIAAGAATLDPATTVHTSVVGFFAYVAISVALASAAALLALDRPSIAGAGIVEFKAYLSGVDLPRIFGVAVLLRKAAGLCAAVGSGLAVGKEGPFVHLGAAIASIVSSFVPMVRGSALLSRELAASGAAAGVAVAFGAPLGGVLFVLEESGFALRRRAVLVCLVAASVATLTLRTIDPSGTGRIVQFAVSHRLAWQWFELPLFALLGFIGGALGVVIVVANGWLYRPAAATTMAMGGTSSADAGGAVGAGGRVVRWIDALRRLAVDHPVRHVALIGFVTACVSYTSPVLRRGMLEVLHDLFVECDHQVHAVASAAANGAASAAASIGVTGDRATDALCSPDVSTSSLLSLLLFAAMVKAMLMVLIIGAKIPQGSFVPSLFVGAAVGRALGSWVQALYRLNPTIAIFASCGSDVAVETSGASLGAALLLERFNGDCIAPGTYAMIGAAALLTGVTRMTLSIAVIMFELTGGLEYVAPCLLASIIAKYTAEVVLGAPSIYDLQLLKSTLPYLDVSAADGAFDLVMDLNVAELLPSTPRDMVVLWHGMRFEDAKKAMVQGVTTAGTHPRWLPVVLSANTSEYVGCVSRMEVLSRIQRAESAGVALDATVAFTTSATYSPAGGAQPPPPALQWASALDPCTVRLTTAASIRHALIAFTALGVHHVVVCRGVDLAAMLTRRDVFAFLKEKDREALRFADSIFGRGGAARYQSDFAGGQHGSSRLEVVVPDDYQDT